MMTNRNKQTFQNLNGTWSLSRTITPGGTYEGQATFTRLSETEYNYAEQGALTLDNGHTTEGSRRYIYHLNNNKIDILFDDGADKGKLFHTLDINENGKTTATHQCLEDHYASQYHFEMPEKFMAEHKVKGPKKDYGSITEFVKTP